MEKKAELKGWEELHARDFKTNHVGRSSMSFQMMLMEKKAELKGWEQVYARDIKTNHVGRSLS